MDYDIGEIIPQVRILTDAQIEKIHSAACEILETTGTRIYNDKAKELLYSHGAYIDSDHIVRIPSHLLDDALRHAPRRIVLCNRDLERTLFLEGRNVHYVCNPDNLDYIDPYTGQRRPYTSEDAVQIAKIVDWTRHIDAVQTGGFAADVPKAIGDRVIIRQMMLNCRKHIGFSCTDADSLLDIIDMAAIVVGSHEALKENSYIFHLQEPISPLVHDENSIKEVMLCAEHNIPIVYYPMPMGGATAPATAAGLLAQNHAESLTGLVIHQLTKPGAPFVYGGAASVMDMKTMRFCYGAPELHLFCTALSDIAHYFEIPFWGTAGCVETDEVNEQAAAELGISLLMAGLGGAQLVHDTGLMDQATLVCPEIMLLADEIMDMVKAILQGIHINEETLALDVINSVGPGGNFLGTDHTYRHFRNFWSPGLFERLTGEKNENKVSFSKRLNERAKNIIETHEVPPLSEDKIKAIKDLEKKWLT